MSARKRIPKETLDKLHERSKGICEQCKRAPAKTDHHILPVSLGGSDELSNLLHVCLACHVCVHPFMRYPPGRRKGIPFFKNELATFYKGDKHAKTDVKILAKRCKKNRSIYH